MQEVLVTHNWFKDVLMDLEAFATLNSYPGEVLSHLAAARVAAGKNSMPGLMTEGRADMLSSLKLNTCDGNDRST